MRELVQLSEEDFFQWIKVQLEKRECVNRKQLEKNTVKELLYEILFSEQELTVEEIERSFIPFGQSGYLTTRQKFEIMLYILEKDYGSSYIFWDGTESCCTVTEEDIEEIYLQWLQEERLYLSEEEKKEFFVQNLMDKLGLGVLEVLKRVAPDGILLGELCPLCFEQELQEERIAVCSSGAIIHLPFLAMKNKEELIQIIRQVIAMENKRELTMMEPILDFVQEDGTCITAVRPPARRDWGIRILYGAARKEVPGWRN